VAQPVVVEFILKGMPDVARAMRTTEQAAAAADKARERSAAQSSKARTRIEEQEAKAKVRAMIKADAELKRIRDRAVRESEQAAKKGAAAAEKAAREETRIAERAANEKLRAARQVDRELAQMEKQRTREQIRAARDRSRENEKISREALRLEEKTHREQTRMLEQRQRSKQNWARGTASRIMGAGRTAMGVLGGAAGMMGQLGGGFSIADSVEREVGLTKQAGKIAASTMNPDGTKSSTSQVLASAKATGIASGIDPREVLEGIDKFKNLTGNTSQGMQLMPDLAKLATAFGGDLGELADNAGNIAQSLGEGASNAEIMTMLRVQTRQGAVGSVELSDMAKYGARLTAGAGLFEGDRATNIGKMGAFSQIARSKGGAASAAEAALAAQRFATDVAGHTDSLKSLGIDVQGKGGKLKDPTQILREMLQKTNGDVTKFKQTGLGERSVRVLTGAADIYSKAGGGKAGMEAFDKEMKKFTDGISEAEVEMRAQERMQDADRQLEKAMIELRTAVGTQLLPEFLRMVPVLRDAIPQVTRLVEGFGTMARWAERNPLSGLSVLIGAAFAKELAAAAVGKLIENALMSSMASKSIAVGSAVMAIAMAKMMIEQEFKAEADAQSSAVGRQLEATNLISKMNRGEKLSPEEQAKAQETLAGMRKDVQTQVDLRENPGLGKMASGAMANIIAPDQAKEAALAEERNRQETIKNLNDTMARLAAAIDRNTGATSKNTDGSGGGTAGTPTPRPAAASAGIAQRNNSTQ
jgi:hypothetical protein